MDTSACGSHSGVMPGFAGLPRSAGTVGVSSGTVSGRAFSGGNRRNLHVTSSDNILGGGHVNSCDR